MTVKEQIVTDTQAIESTLEEFGFNCRVMEAHVEVDTILYELSLAGGVKIMEIVELKENLKIAIGRQIESIAPVLSKKRLGIRVHTEL